MNRLRFALVVIDWMAGCAEPSESVRDGMPGIITAAVHLPDSLESLATDVRAAGGAVAVLETVSVDSTGFTESAPVPVEDLFERYPVSTFTVRVVDDLGETLPSTFTVTAIVGPVEFVDSDGAPRTDWTVSGALPARIRMPATEGTWVWFGTQGTTGLESVMRAASLDDGMVSGEFTSSGVDVALEALRR